MKTDHIRNRMNSNVTQFYHLISKKEGNCKAAVDVSDKLLIVVYWVMKGRQMYERLG